MNRLLGVIRAPFLPLTPACVSVGAAAAVYTGDPLEWSNLWVALIAAVAAHVAVNALNEYADYRSGLDRNTVKTPFSGGSGTLVAAPQFAPVALVVGVAALGVCVICGFYLFFAAGWGLLPPGLLGAAIVAGYTPWINRYPLMCLLAPGVGFGPIMVMGTFYALTGYYSPAVAIASLFPLFAVSNLLLLNQFPDVEPDRDAGRRHLPILIGLEASGRVFAVFWGLAYVSVVAGVIAAVLPATALLGLATAPLAVAVTIKIRNRGERIESLVPWMALNVVAVLVGPVLLAVGLWLGRPI